MSKSLSDPITEIKGIGEETAANLATMHIATVGDLLEHFPYRYEDYRLRDLTEVKHEERVTVEGKVHSEPSLQFFGKKKSRLTIRLLVGQYLIKAVFFNQAYLKTTFSINDTITVSGKWDQHRQTITVNQYKTGPHQQMEEFESVYATKGKLTSKSIRRYIKEALKHYSEAIEENLPPCCLQSYQLLSRSEAIRSYHFPRNNEEVKQARRRFVYEEFLHFQLKMQALRKMEREHAAGSAKHYDLQKLKQFISTLPFPLTTAQKRTVNEICADLKAPFRMNRLLQGDVGSGKTVVSAIAIYASVTAGYQGALMVPTEILAEQHAASFRTMLEPMGITIALLTSSVKGKKRQEMLQRLQDGEINCIIGTHALIQEDVSFQNLGLVITDEQHRFGVEQRRILKDKGLYPDTLFMTATPIPRTLAITAFGEMDVSIIDEMPAGRKPVETYWAKHEMLERVLQFMEKELRNGRQAYVICPLIEESDKLDVQNALDVYEMLTNYYSSRYTVGLMHGRLSSQDKEAAMQAFSANKSQILVATTVVEVGVNVPNATMMVIYDAERFGLAQLHQLRGRVGRGSDQSFCVLLANPKTAIGKERMKIMTETNDGFALSERDLELRGPGDFFGKKQSGLPEFKVADMVHDYRALETARKDAIKFIHSELFWSQADYAPLRNYLEKTGALSGSKLD